MFAQSGGAEQKLPCRKRVWVMTVLSDDESLGTDQTLPPGLEFHLSRCADCRRLADELLAVRSGLAALTLAEPPDELFFRANAQAEDALASGATLTGRVELRDDGTGLLRADVRRAWRRWVAPIAVAATIALAVGIVSVVRGLRDGGSAAPGAMVEAPVATPRPPKPVAALAGDRVDTKRDATAIPGFHRGEGCEGEDCIERPFVPGRTRRNERSRNLDRAPQRGLTSPAPDDR